MEEDPGDPRDSITWCSVGLVECDDLDDEGMAERIDFTLRAFRERNKDWGAPKKRPEIKYPVSCSIQTIEMAGVFEEFSIKKSNGKPMATVRDAIMEYIFRLNSPNHLFCIHPKLNPGFYYEKTILKATKQITQIRNLSFPQIIIVTVSADESNQLCNSLVRERNRAQFRQNECGIENLDQEQHSTHRHDRILIGSSQKINEFIIRVTGENQMKELASCCKFVIIHGVERINVSSRVTTQELKDSVTLITERFNYSWTRFIFMYNFTSRRIRNSLKDTVKWVNGLVKEGMFVEVDTPRTRQLFESIEFKLIVPPEEKANQFQAVAMQTSEEGLSDEAFNEAKAKCGTYFQKNYHCLKLIHELINKRKEDNKTNRRPRRERILIITKDKLANAVLFTNLHKLRKKSFTLKTMSVYDSVERVERLNYEFRHGNLDVLVIDWKSIQSVIRGTVDAVILYDQPHPKYFQTMMETEMENLMSRNCVKIKLFILFDQTKDCYLLPEYLKLCQKYKHRIPQWFELHYKKFVEEWKIRMAEREIVLKEVQRSTDPI